MCVKVMLIGFINAKGIVHAKFVSPGHTAGSEILPSTLEAFAKRWEKKVLRPVTKLSVVV